MKRIFFVITGTFIMAAALNIFIEPCSLVTGGASGLAVIVKAVGTRFFGISIPLWLTNAALNLPLLIWSYTALGGKFTSGTTAGTLLLSLFLKLTEGLPSLAQKDIFIGAVFGGAIMGLGLGLVLSGGAATGGSDLLAALINKANGSFGIPMLIFLTDSAVVAAGMFVFGISRTMYSIMAVYISARATSLVLEGLNFARVVFIISDKANLLAAALMSELDRGATVLYGEGAFTGSKKHIIMMAVSRSQIAKVRETVAVNDRNAFMLVSDVREVLGDFSRRAL